MKYFDWDKEKNDWLIKHRDISFEICQSYVIEGNIVAIVTNHPPYEHQRVFILNINNYIYRVPYIEDDEKYFLKTAYPSRKDTKKYLPEK